MSFPKWRAPSNSTRQQTILFVCYAYYVMYHKRLILTLYNLKKKRNKICVYSINVFFFSKTGYKMLIVAIKMWYKIYMEIPLRFAMARKLAQKALWLQRGYLQQQKKLNVCYIIKKNRQEFLRQLHLDLKPSLPLAI